MVYRIVADPMTLIGNSSDLEWHSRSCTQCKPFKTRIFVHFCSSDKIGTDITRRAVSLRQLSFLSIEKGNADSFGHRISTVYISVPVVKQSSSLSFYGWLNDDARVTSPTWRLWFHAPMKRMVQLVAAAQLDRRPWTTTWTGRPWTTQSAASLGRRHLDAPPPTPPVLRIFRRSRERPRRDEMRPVYDDPRRRRRLAATITATILDAAAVSRWMLVALGSVCVRRAEVAFPDWQSAAGAPIVCPAQLGNQYWAAMPASG